MRILVTGASGFVGREFCCQALAAGYLLKRVLRRADAIAAEDVVVGDLETRLDWSEAMHGVDVVLHLAARVHQMRESVDDPDAVYRAANVEVTRRLVQQAAAAGVKRFVFVSSVKVNGEGTVGTLFRETDEPMPQDSYGRSKREAEVVLQAQANAAGMEWVVVRPTLVYGVGARGNFLRLMRALRYGLPFPLARATSPRSMVGVENLAALLLLCCSHPAASGQIFLAADWAPGTAELIRTLARSMGMHSRLWPFPVVLLRIAARLPRVGAALSRLTGELLVDAGKAYKLLGWKAEVAPEESVRRMVAAFLEGKEK